MLDINVLARLIVYLACPILSIEKFISLWDMSLCVAAGITRVERLVLARICEATAGSKSAHVPEHSFIKKFKDVKAARKALKKLVSCGYVARHPTRDEMTYQMTQAGWEECRRMKAEAPK